MPTARDIMSPDVAHLAADQTVADAAELMARHDVGALPVCDSSGQLSGMITDRDLVVKVLVDGRDPNTTTVGEIADQPEVVTIGADDSAEEAIRTMKEHGVRRLPVIDGTSLVGVVSQADVARELPDSKVGDLVGALSEAPPNN
jgi:CBS domain-containing protein